MIFNPFGSLLDSWHYGLLTPGPGVSLEALSPDVERLSLCTGDLRGLERLPRLRKLALPRESLNKASLSTLKSLTPLEHLSLQLKSAPSAALIAALKALPRLQSLHVAMQAPSVEALTEAASLPRLDVLEIDGKSRWKEESLTALSQATSLRALVLRQPGPITPRLIELLAGLPSLTVLEIDRPRAFQPDTLPALASLTSLRGLRLVASRCGDEDKLSQLTSIPALEALSLSHCPARGALAHHLASCTGLRVLDLGWSNIEGTPLSALEALSRLESLNLDNSKTPAPVLEALFQRLPLRGLHAHSQPTAQWLKALVDRDLLDDLSLGSAHVSADALAHLARLTHLKRLDLSGMSGGVRALPAIGDLRSLECLYLSQLSLSDDTLKTVTQLTELRELDLSWTSSATESALRGLTRLQSLRSLFLVSCHAVTPSLARTLVTELNLEHLNLSRCPAMDQKTVAELRSLRPALSIRFDD